jgi:ABC-type lipoprotein export system ATPase subunit
VLELERLTRRFGDVTALDDVTFSVGPGEICGFVGRNGAGKTTAMRIVLGLLEPHAGEVRWHGRSLDAAARRRFGYMPEERGLYPKMRVGAHLAYLARLHGVDAAQARAAAAHWTERLGVAERAGDRIEQLSLGNQQRVQLGAALVHDPELLILDEPFSGSIRSASTRWPPRSAAARPPVFRCCSPATSSTSSKRSADPWRSSTAAASSPPDPWRACGPVLTIDRWFAWPSTAIPRGGGPPPSTVRICAAAIIAAACSRCSTERAPTRCSTRRAPPAR